MFAQGQNCHRDRWRHGNRRGSGSPFYLREGASVVVPDVKSKQELEATYRNEDASSLLMLQADVTTRESIGSIVRSTVEKFSCIDILYNNAAVFDMRPLLDESWDILTAFSRSTSRACSF